jgi:hypothetical protein
MTITARLQFDLPYDLYRRLITSVDTQNRQLIDTSKPAIN